MAASLVSRHLAAGSIRLFRLYHATTDALSGSLIAVRLNEAPPYFALSYCWGKQKQDVPVQINGQVVCVSPSLVDAIRRLWKLGAEDPASDIRVEWVWIDQICINQDDIQERSAQVQLMGSIYSQAIRTL